MIVREEKDHFVMIEQDNHAILSSEIMANWKEDLFLGKKKKDSVLFAIKYHDYGWKYFDKQPFWNDRIKAPYTFSDFPLSPKTIVYTHGINEVQKHDRYAALLCSEHYAQFLEDERAVDARRFVQQEKERQKQILLELGEINESLFQFHYGLLKFGDGLSLYLCINEPAVSQENVHSFFQKGIELPTHLPSLDETRLSLDWYDKQTVFLDPFPFKTSITIRIPQKRILKKDIHEKGLVSSYEQAPYEEVEIYLKSKAI
ncbi:DUF3891 family protein [Oceanobacillus senegalensis]|uniref:DUF3891 family protein n=1 Tax=Oceanobacillus senegalensis TaxID=1936063 RepID=UPI000A312ED3|nr:DUF3891 family protein [Oceanobacillus senegalensis]